MIEPFPRTVRTLAGSLAAVALVFVAPAAASGASTPSGATEASLQTQAQELAGQIQADGQTLDRVAEAVNAAQLRANQLATQTDALKATMANTNSQVVAARAALRQQAILDYITGGQPVLSPVMGKAGSDPTLTASYAEIVAGGQQRAVANYRAVLAAQQTESKQLATAQAQTATLLSQLKADRASASAAMAARQHALAQVKGQLAVLVAQVQKAQQAAEEARLRSQLSQHSSLPPSTPAVDPPAAPTTTRPQPAPTTAPHQNPTPTTSPPTTAPPPPPPPPGGNAPAAGWQTAVHYAYAQLGKPYQWGGAGPGSFDCSGLTMMAWAAAGVSLPHLAQGQYDLSTKIPLSDVEPGDLIFFGTPTNVYHVGIYIGGGQMIDAPETGQDVSISSIYWSNLLGAGRV